MKLKLKFGKYKDMAWDPLEISDPFIAFDYWNTIKKDCEAIGYINLNLDEIQCKFPKGIKKEISNFFDFIYELDHEFIDVNNYGGMSAYKKNKGPFFRDKIIAYPRMPYLLQQYTNNGGFNDPISLYDSPVFGKPTVHPGKGRFYILKNFTDVKKENFVMFDTFGKFTDRFFIEFSSYDEMIKFFPNHILTFFVVDRHGTVIIEPFFQSKKTISSYSPDITQVVVDMIKFFKTYQLSANFDLKEYNYKPNFFKKFTSNHIHIESRRTDWNDFPFTWMIYNLEKEDPRFKLTLKSLL